MRSVLTTVIACLLLPFASVVAQSTELPQKHEEVETSNQQQKPQPPKQERESEGKSDLDFSGTGRPGQQTAGESRGSCVNAPKPIKAMLPQSNSGSTVLGHPSFWVYFPELDNKTTELEFIIQDESRKDIWRSRSSQESTTGYQSFSLPKTEAPLEVDQWYRWYVKVYCDNQIVSTQYVQGWVNRVPLNSRLYLDLQQNPAKSHLTYGTNRIWYDAIDRLLSSYHRHPQSITLEKDWQNLIRAKGVQLRGLPSIGGNQIGRR